MTEMRGLRRMASPKPPAPPPPPQVETCEMCGTTIPGQHGHIADTHEHRLLCVCRPCALLFDAQGSGGMRYRGVGTDCRRVDDLRIDEAQWDLLQIPVDLAFFFRQSGVDDVVAFYPGPSGATESTLDLSAWAGIVADNPVLDTAEADVESVLLRRHDGGFSCYLTPVDICYELVGIVRTHWVGLSGGADVWERIDRFFADLDRRGRRVDRVG